MITKINGNIHFDFTEEVERGAKFLDIVKPGWEASIDPTILEMKNTNYCICGQAFTGHFAEGADQLQRFLLNQGEEFHEHSEYIGQFSSPLCSAAEYGFCRNAWASVFAPSDQTMENENKFWSALGEAWLDLILYRSLIKSLKVLPSPEVKSEEPVVEREAVLV